MGWASANQELGCDYNSLNQVTEEPFNGNGIWTIPAWTALIQLPRGEAQARQPRIFIE